MKAILGQKLVPGLLDRYLGRIGYGAQQTGQPVSPGRRDNVDQPLPGDRGAHGEFDARARGWSAELWFRMNRRWILGAAAAAGAAVLGWRALSA